MSKVLSGVHGSARSTVNVLDHDYQDIKQPRDYKTLYFRFCHRRRWKWTLNCSYILSVQRLRRTGQRQPWVCEWQQKHSSPLWSPYDYYFTGLPQGGPSLWNTFHFLPEGIPGKSQWRCAVGLSKGLTLFQSNTYKVNLMEYPREFLRRKKEHCQSLT